MLSGDAIVGSTLSATVTDNDGLESADIAYQWMAGDKVISSATSSSYLLIEADVDSTITVSVTYTDDNGHSEISKSAPSDTVEIPAVPSEGSITISGDAFEGSVLTALITDANGFGETEVEYLWMVDGSDITDANTDTYTLTAAELGSTISVTATYTDNDEFEEAVTSAVTGVVVIEPLTPVEPVVPMTQVASITDNMTDDAGELRYKHSSVIEAGKLSLSFAKDEVMTADGSAKEAYVALYGNSTSTSKALVDLRIGNGTFTIRDQDNITVTATFTPGDWVDVEMTWDASSASATVAPLVTITINGTAVTVDAFPSVSSELATVMAGVETVVFKLSDTSSVVTGAYLVDDIKLYADIAGTTIAFEDDFETYAIEDSLDTDNTNSPYNSSTAEAVVVEAEDAVAPVETTPEPTTTKVASITDNMTDDAGELRYKHSSTIEAGKLNLSFAKDEVMTADGSAKEAYVALYGNSTSTSKALVDLRIGNGTFTIRDQDNITVAATFTPGDWVDVEMTWDASSASATVAPLVTITINGTAVTVDAFPSVSSELATVMAGVETIVFKLSDTSSVVTGAYLVDDIKLYADIVGTTIAFEDNFEAYAIADSLDTDNANSPYNSSTAEAVVVEVTK